MRILKQVLFVVAIAGCATSADKRKKPELVLNWVSAKVVSFEHKSVPVGSMQRGSVHTDGETATYRGSSHNVNKEFTEYQLETDELSITVRPYVYLNKWIQAAAALGGTPTFEYKDLRSGAGETVKIALVKPDTAQIEDKQKYYWAKIIRSAKRADGPLTNEGVVKLRRVGFSDFLILAKIQEARAVAFRLAPSDLEQLKADGLSEVVLAAMLERGRIQ